MIRNQDFESSVAEGKARKKAALDRVAANNKEFIEQAVETIETLREFNQEITSDDVWIAHTFYGVANPKAMGVAFVIAESLGLIKATDRFKLSCRPVCHRRPLRVWEVL
jgi:hypothetical protein